MRCGLRVAWLVFGVLLVAGGVAGGVASGGVQAARAQSAQNELAALSLPPHFTIEQIANLPGARSIAVAPEIQAVFIGTRGPFLYAFYDNKRVLLSARRRVANGVAWKPPYLYLAEQHQIVRFRFDRFTDTLPPEEVFFTNLPDKNHHGWRYIATRPDSDNVFVTVGAPCNVCLPQELEGTLIEIHARNRFATIIAKGVRNSVGMDFSPYDGSLWFTDNGSDNMGPDEPPDELNQLTRKGEHFGFPWFGGGRARTHYNQSPPPNDASLPRWSFAAHTVALGVHFYRHRRLPLKNSALIAMHGSWRYNNEGGFSLLKLNFDAASGQPVAIENFVTGFDQLPGKKGRPVDVKTLWDGSLVVSDDSRGALYRIDYAPPAASREN